MNKCMHVEWNKKALHHQLDMVPRGTYIASGTFPIKEKLSNALQSLTRKGKKKKNISKRTGWKVLTESEHPCLGRRYRGKTYCGHCKSSENH